MSSTQEANVFDIETNIRFIISSKESFDCNIITQELALEPTKYYKKGDLVFSGGTRTYDYSGWIFGNRTKGNIDIGNEVSRLLDVLIPKVLSVNN